MELDTIKNSWRQENEQITANILLNKEGLLKKITKETNRMKRKNLLILLFRLPFPIAIFGILLMHLHIRNMFNFFIGIILFSAFAVFTIWGLINYYRKLRKLDLTESYIENKKKVNELELYKLKVTKRNYCSCPIGIAGIFLIINMPLFNTTEGAIMLILISTIMAASIFINLKYILPGQFRRLNEEIEKIKELEDDK